MLPMDRHGVFLTMASALPGLGALGTKLVSVAGTGAVVENTLTRDRAQLDDTIVVLACGMVPNDGLALQLQGKVPEIHLVGDALAPRRIMHATVEGARVAMGI